jgi:hypothetical protein
MNSGTSTFTFTGAAGNINGAAAKNFNNLTINNGAGISNNAGGNITIKNNFTNNGIFTQAPTLTTTFDASNATHNLSGAGATTFGNLIITGGTTVNGGSHNFSVVGAAINVDGTFNGGTGTLTMNGGIAQSIAGTGTKNFNNLMINNPNGVTVNDTPATVDSSVSGILTLLTDLTIAPSAILQQSGTSAGIGDAVGIVRRTDLDINAKAFGNPNISIAILSGTAPNPMDISLAKNAPADFPAAINRDYNLMPTGGNAFSATVTLHYLVSELNGNNETGLVLWKKNGAWSAQGRTGIVDVVNKAVTLTGVSSFSEWTLAQIDPPTITKSFDAAAIPLNGITSLTFTISNPNLIAALTGIAFNDNLPAGLVVATPNNLNNTCGATATATPGSGTVSLSGATLPGNNFCTLAVDVQGTTEGVMNNTTDPITSNESGTGATSNTATITVIAPPSITKQFGTLSIPVGSNTTLSFTITNINAADALADVGVIDVLPVGLVVANPNGLFGSCGAGTITADPGSSSLSLTGGTIAASDSCTFGIDVTAVAQGTQVNTTAPVTSSNGGTGNTATASLDTTCSVITVTPAVIPSGLAGAPYSVTFGQIGGQGTVVFTQSGTLPTGMTFNNGVLSGTPTETGNFSITVLATDSFGCIGSQDYTLMIDCPTITLDPLTLPSGTKGVNYPPVTFNQTGGVGSATFSQSGLLPLGMNFSGGVLSGRPRETGSFPITVTATDSAGCTGSRDYILAIACNNSDLTISPDVVPSGVENVAYTDTTFTVDGGTAPYSFQQSGILPAGMNFIADTLSGTPTESGTFPFTISVTDNAGCAQSKGYILTISCSGVAISISPSSLPLASLNVPFSSTTFTPTGGAGPYSFVVFGALPEGISLDQNTGILSGTPTEPGAFPFLLQATDSNGCSGTQQYTFTTCIFCADFESDPLSQPPPGWTKVRGFTVVQTGSTQSLQGATINRKATILTPGFTDLPNRTVEVSALTFLNIESRYMLYGWRQDNTHYVKLIIKPEINKLVLLQRDGLTRRKAKFIPLTPLQTSTPYDIKITFSGGAFQVFLNNQLLGSMTSIATPVGGNAYFLLRSTSTAEVQATFDSLLIY